MTAAMGWLVVVVGGAGCALDDDIGVVRGSTAGAWTDDAAGDQSSTDMPTAAVSCPSDGEPFASHYKVTEFIRPAGIANFAGPIGSSGAWTSLASRLLFCNSVAPKESVVVEVEDSPPFELIGPGCGDIQEIAPTVTSIRVRHPISTEIGVHFESDYQIVGIHNAPSSIAELSASAPFASLFPEPPEHPTDELATLRRFCDCLIRDRNCGDFAVDPEERRLNRHALSLKRFDVDSCGVAGTGFRPYYEPLGLIEAECEYRCDLVDRRLVNSLHPPQCVWPGGEPAPVWEDSYLDLRFLNRGIDAAAKTFTYSFGRANTPRCADGEFLAWTACSDMLPIAVARSAPELSQALGPSASNVASWELTQTDYQCATRVAEFSEAPDFGGLGGGIGVDHGPEPAPEPAPEPETVTFIVADHSFTCVARLRDET